MKKLPFLLAIAALALLVVCAYQLHTIGQSLAGAYPVDAREIRLENTASEWAVNECYAAGYSLTASWTENGVRVKHFEKRLVGRAISPLGAKHPD